MSRKLRKQRRKNKGRPKKLPLSKTEMWQLARLMMRIPPIYAGKENKVFYEKGIRGCYAITGDRKFYCKECRYNPCLKITDKEL
jgi:hypothetical protein